MNLENILAISGFSGLFKMVANRSNGLIVEHLTEGKRRFVSARKHQFTPLESIAIYTDDGDSTELKNVFRNMLDQLEDNPPVGANEESDTIMEYFAEVLPNFDRDRVHVGDVKKVLKWFNFLHESGHLNDPGDETAASEEEE